MNKRKKMFARCKEFNASWVQFACTFDDFEAMYKIYKTDPIMIDNIGFDAECLIDKMMEELEKMKEYVKWFDSTQPKPTCEEIEKAVVEL